MHHRRIRAWRSLWTRMSSPLSVMAWAIGLSGTDSASMGVGVKSDTLVVLSESSSASSNSGSSLSETTSASMGVGVKSEASVVLSASSSASSENSESVVSGFMAWQIVCNGRDWGSCGGEKKGGECCTGFFGTHSFVIVHTENRNDSTAKRFLRNGIFAKEVDSQVNRKYLFEFAFGNVDRRCCSSSISMYRWMRNAASYLCCPGCTKSLVVGYVYFSLLHTSSLQPWLVVKHASILSQYVSWLPHRAQKLWPVQR